ITPFWVRPPPSGDHTSAKTSRPDRERHGSAITFVTTGACWLQAPKQELQEEEGGDGDGEQQASLPEHPPFAVRNADVLLRAVAPSSATRAASCWTISSARRTP